MLIFFHSGAVLTFAFGCFGYRKAAYGESVYRQTGRNKFVLLIYVTAPQGLGTALKRQQ